MKAPSSINGNCPIQIVILCALQKGLWWWTSGKQRCLDRDVLGLIPATLEEPDFSNFIKRQRTLKHLRKRYNLCYTALTTLDNYILGANSVMGLLIDKTIILYPLGSWFRFNIHFLCPYWCLMYWVWHRHYAETSEGVGRIQHCSHPCK